MVRFPFRALPLRRGVAPFLLALTLVLVAGAPGAEAGRTWCREDPVIKVDGQVVDVFVSSDVAMLSSATGPVKIKITVPSGSSVGVYATDQGFGDGYAITLATSTTLKKTSTSTPVKVEVYAPSADGSLPVKVDVTPRSQGGVKAASKQGLANAWVTLTTP